MTPRPLPAVIALALDGTTHARVGPCGAAAWAVPYSRRYGTREIRYSRVLAGSPRRWRAVGSCRVLGEYWSARLLRHGRGPRVPCLSCAGAYLFGAAGSNECPAGSVRIEAEAACRTAVAAAGKTPGSPFVQASSSSPRGCYYAPDLYFNYAYLNTHPVGAGYSNTRPLCGSVTTGAPFSDARRCTRSCCIPARAAAPGLCRSGQCTAVWGTPGVWFVWYGTVGYSKVLSGTHAGPPRGLVYRTVEC